MNQDTPAIAIKEKDLAANCMAAIECLKRIPTNAVKTIVDIRYGLGGWASVALEKFPTAAYLGFEQDEETAKAAWTNAQVDLRVERFSFAPSPDLLLADFNTVTLLKRELLDEAVKSIKPSYLIFTDVCCSKLHLNYPSYGLKEPNLGQYWKQFPITGYSLRYYAKSHHAASTALYVLTKKPGQ